MQNLKPADVIAKRFRCLYAMYLRGHAELTSKKHSSGLRLPTSASSAEIDAMSRRALADPSLSSCFTATERQLIKKKFGNHRTHEARYCLYRACSMNVLAWALRGFDLHPDPGYLKFVVEKPALTPETVLGGERLSWLDRPKLRPKAELERHLIFEQAWAWRVRVEILRQASFVKAPFSEPDGLEKFLEQQVAKRAAACEAQGFFEARKGDFPTGRSTYGRIGDIGFPEALQKVIDERVRAASWVLDPNSPWDSASAASAPGFAVPRACRGLAYSESMKSHFDPPTGVETFRFHQVRYLPIMWKPL